LTVGDIEEIDGKKCVDCPWHHYKVTLEGGEKLYQSTVMDPETKKLKPAGWKSVGKRQRVHM
jgi:nitrite reductase/ring-hydroxylating ferredoxin subunit